RVRRRRVSDRVPGAGEGAEAELDQLVAAVADDDVAGWELEPARDRLPSGCGRRARVEPQRVGGRRLDRVEHPGRGRQRRLVGVELDPAFAVGRLLAGDVRLK